MNVDRRILVIERFASFGGLDPGRVGPEDLSELSDVWRQSRTFLGAHGGSGSGQC